MLYIKKYFKKNSLLYFFCFILLFFNIFFYFFIIKAQENKIIQLSNDYLSIRKKSIQFLNNKNENRAIYTQKKILSFIHKLPNKKKIADAGKKLINIFKKNGFTLKKIIFKPKHIGEYGLLQCSTTLSLDGSYKKCRKAISMISDLSGLFCIENIKIKKKKNLKDITLKINLSTYFNKYKESAIKDE
jgi:Tfp pilus assembly protein PilO